MHIKGKSILLLLTFVLIYSANGYPQEKLVLTLDKCVHLALKNNPQIKMVEKELSKAKSGIGEAYSNILPQLSASANFQHSWVIQKNVIPNFLKPMLGPIAPMLPDYEDMPDFVKMSFALENTFVYGAALTQPLFLGGAGIAGVKIAYAAKRAAEQNLEIQRQDLIYQTVKAFYSSLLAKELVQVQQEALKQAEANFDIVKKRYQAGAASGFDKMRAEVEVANLKPDVISSKNSFQVATTLLRTVLGLERNTKIEIEGQFNFIEDDFGNKPLDEIQKMALQIRPEMKAMHEQKYIAKKGISLARSNFLPKVFFQTDYSYLAMKNDYRFSQSDFNRGFTSAISLQIPLFTGFRSAKQYQKAKLDYRIVLDVEKQINDGISAETEVVYNFFQEAMQKYDAANQSVGLAREALRLANMMYEEGANTQLDVMSSQLALTHARLNYVSSLFQYQMARYQLRKVTGTLKQVL